jgi:hypothetical protein
MGIQRQACSPPSSPARPPSAIRARTAAVFIEVGSGAGLFMLSMAGASAYLVANLKPGRTSVRHVAAAFEVFMACFGLLIAYAEASAGVGTIAGFSVSAGLVGTIPSMTAAVRLLSRAARILTRSVGSE